MDQVEYMIMVLEVYWILARTDCELHVEMSAECMIEADASKGELIVMS